MSKLLHLLGEGGLDALSRLIVSEKAEGGGIDAMKESVVTMQQDLDELLRQTSLRNEEVDEMFEDLSDKQVKLKEEIVRQGEAIRDLTNLVRDFEQEIVRQGEAIRDLTNL